jgi:hypothetical protein
MAKNLIPALAVVALLSSGAQAATATPAKPTATKPAAAKPAPAAAPAKPSLFSRLTSAVTPEPAAKPAAAPAKPAVHHASADVANGRMVTTKTSTGKTITYNCSKAGNVHKKACA